MSSKEIKENESVKVVHSLQELLDYLKTIQEEIFIIGGGQVYECLIKYANKMILTEIDDIKEADTYFPKFTLDNWDRNFLSEHSINNLNYKRYEYTRKLKL